MDHPNAKETLQMRDILAQLAPAAATETLLYDCPRQTLADIDSVMSCNRGTTGDTVRVSISKAGVATSNADYLYYDLPIDGNDTHLAAIGLVARAGDIVRVRSTLGTCSFTLLGDVAKPVPDR